VDFGDGIVFGSENGYVVNVILNSFAVVSIVCPAARLTTTASDINVINLLIMVCIIYRVLIKEIMGEKC